MRLQTLVRPLAMISSTEPSSRRRSCKLSPGREFVRRFVGKGFVSLSLARALAADAKQICIRIVGDARFFAAVWGAGDSQTNRAFRVEFRFDIQRQALDLKFVIAACQLDIADCNRTSLAV